MVRIKFIQTRRFSSDGHTVKQYRAGEVYEVEPHSQLLITALRRGWAEKVEDDRSIMDVMTDLGLRCEYHAYLSDTSKPLLDFEEWKAERMRSVPTNPATHEAKGDRL